MYEALVDDLERVRFKVQVEKSLNSHDHDLEKRLGYLSLEVEDALEKARFLADQLAEQSQRAENAGKVDFVFQR